MKVPRIKLPLIPLAGLVLCVAWGVAPTAQIPPIPQHNLPLDPAHDRGASITPAYEGWFQNQDGSFSLLVGYFNRNTKEPIDIPVGPNNKLEPGDPDQGQPTHFEPGRQWGMFVIKVPKDFGTKALTWTVSAHGEAQSVPFTLNKGYPITPFKESGMGNQPPVLAFSQGGPKVTGPPMTTAATLEGATNQPVTIPVWVEDPKGEGEELVIPGFTRENPKVATVSFHKFRGPGTIAFDKARIPVQTQGEKISSAATFSAPGEYVVRVQANDESGEGGGGFQCCWTNAYVKVVVK
ncbi:MAG TPA: hypothetical protein VNZ26_22935 [Vicinamibacterales bacterium]|nr:hypothetical protein [Vicinamibacterales bacterium]